MFIGYFEVSVNFNVQNRREKFIILISILYPIYRILIRSQNLLCFLSGLLMSFLMVHEMFFIFDMQREGASPPAVLPMATYLTQPSCCSQIVTDQSIDDQHASSSASGVLLAYHFRVWRINK